MAYAGRLADRVRAQLEDHTDVVETSMFGGIAFMVRGHMTVGLASDDLVIRVAATDYERMLDEPHARPMDFTGRPMRGWIYDGTGRCQHPGRTRPLGEARRARQM